ncbi:MAG: enoyl-CoA hydratase/isomerase family protein, partial [Acidimicrobiia bacterium]
MSILLIETVDGVCRATLDRPGRLNALGEELRSELESLLSKLADDAETRVLLLQGAGRSFSAGADLRDTPAPAKTWSARRLASGRWQRLLDQLESIPQVTVAKLHGHVVGGAVLLAASCDFRVAAEDVDLFIPELALGIPLTWAGLPRLVREIGLPRTRELVMTGCHLSGREAFEWGFVQRLATSDELDAA